MSSQAATPVQMAQPKSVLVTQSAANKVYELMQEEGNFNLKLRVYIEGGGCSGFQYGFTFDKQKNADDFSIKKGVTPEGSDDEDDDEDGGGEGGVEFLIDPMSYQYLVGAEIDYKDDLEGARFIIRNPNATTTCGCGSSFSI